MNGIFQNIISFNNDVTAAIPLPQTMPSAKRCALCTPCSSSARSISVVQAHASTVTYSPINITRSTRTSWLFSTHLSFKTVAPPTFIFLYGRTTFHRWTSAASQPTFPPTTFPCFQCPPPSKIHQTSSFFSMSSR